jgi:hypothetical protein
MRICPRWTNDVRADPVCARPVSDSSGDDAECGEIGPKLQNPAVD